MSILTDFLTAILNSLWQAAVVAGVVWLALRLLRRGSFAHINAATRYAIWWAVLAVTLALPAAPSVMRWWHARTRTTADAGVKPAAPGISAAPLIEEQAPIVTLREEREARWPFWVLGIWGALCLYRLSQIARSYVYLRGVKRRAVASEAALPAIVRPARLLLSGDVSSPMAVGFLHPAVILPEALPAELAQPEMEHVLLHEVAHIARRDDWTNLLARLLGAGLALHPVAWWILRQIDREREMACDDWVVARTGSARPYAQSLARMSELRRSKSAVEQGEALASGMFGGGSRLGERIEMLLVRGRVFSTRASRPRVAASALALFGFLIAASFAPRLIAFAQQPVDPAFEVASIRENKSVGEGIGTFPPKGATYSVTNVPLGTLIAVAYGTVDYKISGMPQWAKDTHYDITAKASVELKYPTAQPYVRRLLADRFKLKVHHETKDGPIYRLSVAAGGPKLQPAKPANDPGSPRGSQYLRGLISARQNSMAQLAYVLAGQFERPIIDETGLAGDFDFRLEWAPDDSADGPSIFTALQEQLGLRLESARGPVEYLVIDHVGKPESN
jgi:uncharacterized protein (TIGR03435 family)